MTLFPRNPSARRATTTVLVALAGLLFVATAQAQSKPPPYPTGIGSPTSGYMVDDVDVAAGTITMAGDTFRVTATSQLTDGEGNTIRLRDVRGIASHGVADIVKFESRRVGGSSTTPEIVTLRLVDLAP